MSFLFDLDLGLVTLILQLDLDMVKIYLYVEKEHPACSGSKVIGQTDRQKHRKTHKHTDKPDWNYYLSTNAGSNKSKSAKRCNNTIKINISVLMVERSKWKWNKLCIGQWQVLWCIQHKQHCTGIAAIFHLLRHLIGHEYVKNSINMTNNREIACAVCHYNPKQCFFPLIYFHLTHC